MTVQSPESTYHERRERFGQQRDQFQRRSDRNANISLVLALGALALFGIWLWQGTLVPLVAAGLLAVAFLASFIHHGRVNRHLRRYRLLWQINDEGLQRLQRNWAALPEPLSEHAEHTRNQSHSSGSTGPRSSTTLRPEYASDLDVLGHASLQHLLGTPTTPAGRETLRRWLLNPAPPEVIRERQQSAAELAPLVEFRDELAVRGRSMGSAQSNYEAFLQWAEGERWLAQRIWLLWLARILPLITISLGVAFLLGYATFPILTVFVIIHFVLILSLGRHVNQILLTISARQSVFRAYANLFELLARQSFTTPALRALQVQLAAGGLRADQQMRRIGRIMPLVDIRGWMFFFPIEIATLWSIHVLWLLERWQQVAGKAARTWLTALGEMEALVALATLTHDHPDWAFPEIVEAGAPVLAAQALGHPLLPDIRVSNDVQLGPPGTFLLVTGSNMSGKSTLLRAIGTNVVLAQAGAPVCAAALRLPPLLLATSMRVQDSLEQGVSFFMAELQRLKAVVDLADQTQAQHGRTLLFLLDEILQGTNTAERQIAARQIIAHLVEQGAIGAVSTHDLNLADAPILAQSSRPVYFTETFTRGPDGPSMQFDYQLRPGIATSTNALKLMELVGLPLKDAHEQVEHEHT